MKIADLFSSEDKLLYIVLAAVLLYILFSVMQSWQKRRRRPPDIEKLKRKRQMKELVKALSHKNESARQAAASALGEVCPGREEDRWRDRAVQALIAVLGDRHEGNRVQRTTITALGNIGDPRAIDPLLAALRGPDATLRSAAATALEKIGHERSVKPLIAALGQQNSEVRRLAIKVLANIGSRHEEPALRKEIAVALNAILSDGEQEIGSAAAQALDQIGQEVDPAAKIPYALAKRDWASIAELGNEAVAPLVAAIEGQDHTLWPKATETLGQLGALKDPAIGPRVTQSLLDRLSSEEHAKCRAAAEGLGYTADKRAIEPLTAALKHRFDLVHSTAALALDRLGWQPRANEMGATYWAAKGKWEKCVEIGAPALPVLLSALEQRKDQRTRRKIAQALVKLYTTKGKLDYWDKRKIVDKKGLFTSHTDCHTDLDAWCFGTHHKDRHTDQGLGVDFPL